MKSVEIPGVLTCKWQRPLYSVASSARLHLSESFAVTLSKSFVKQTGAGTHFVYDFKELKRFLKVKYLLQMFLCISFDKICMVHRNSMH